MNLHNTDTSTHSIDNTSPDRCTLAEYNLTVHLAQYNISFERAVPLLSSIQVDLLQLSLGLRYFSPRVQLYRQLASTIIEASDEAVQNKINQCVASAGLWVQINNNQDIVCDLDSLNKALRSVQYPFSLPDWCSFMFVFSALEPQTV
jgi:hypothetical protein